MQALQEAAPGRAPDGSGHAPDGSGRAPTAREEVSREEISRAEVSREEISREEVNVVGIPAMLDALVVMVDLRDSYTWRHSQDVSYYARRIARGLGLCPAEVEWARVAGLLHDAGKIGVPDAVLRKPAPLTAEEMLTMRQHPQLGAAVVGAFPELAPCLDAIRFHHERWDGAGYPFGLAGEEIPLSARIMAVADGYSAMTTDRPYRRGMERAEALAILEAGAGSQWCPECVQAFLGTFQHV